eukprot:5367833-Prorocentrum_lima.AAC.1
MTSSLVGSEMCIRDSFIAFVGHAPTAQDNMITALSSETLLDEIEDQRAVSYTHLTLPTICSV